MSRQWNGKLLDNDYQGDALASIIMDWVAIPCAIITTIGAVWWVHLMGGLWFQYLLALILGPIAGLLLAAFVGLGAVFVLVVLYAALFPFITGYERITE